MTRLRKWLAQRRLAKMVNANLRSFETEQYRRRRAAALKGIGRVC